METASIDESIRVGVAFDDRKVFPMWFRWRSRYYKIRKVTFTWSTNHGSSLLRHYSVSDGLSIYELCFDTNTLEWTLARVCSG